MTAVRKGPRTWQFRSHTAVENGKTVLFLGGRLGHAAAREFEATAKAVLETGIPDLAIDLSAVDYLSSAGLKVLETLAIAQKHQGGRLTLRAPSPAARLSLELSGLADLVGG
ncbi:MAG TPA: STAS domain-containing protein [Vicinamibacterales bacterium]|nr:STAS domain-containing protein [Vicinamibacterales bacterium]